MPKPNILILLVFLLTTFSLACAASATEEIAGKTGAECKVCHKDPLGGGELTEVGRGYQLSLDTGTSQETGPQKPTARIFRILVGYLHIITAFLWFGTILYVHLVLKPAYASTGLPRGEVRVGLVSMVIIGLTGAVLTYYKVPSPDLLFSSRFGILLLAKIVIFSIMVLSALFVVLVIGPRLKKKTKAAASPVAKGDLSLAELTNFDGKEGRPAYFAYRSKIYDVTESKLWKEGNHMKRHQAGVDLTDILAQAPHEEDKVVAMPEVGNLIEKEKTPKKEPHKKVFFFMAYMNLGFVFIICLILALWRW